MKKLIQQLTRPLILLFILALSLLMLLSTFTLNQVMMKDIDQLNQDILASKANDISSFLNMRISEIQSMALLYDANLSLDENLSQMRLLSQLDKGYESLGIVDMNGYKHVTTGAVFSVQEREYYKQFMASNELTFISDPVESKDNHEHIILILTKVIQEDQIVAIVSGAINLNYIQKVLNDSNTFNFETILLNNKTQSIILETGNEASSHAKTYIQSLALHPCWSLQMQVPHSFFYQRLILVNFAILLFACVIGFIVTYFMRKTIVRILQPIHDLTETMKQVTLNHLVPIQVSDECEELHDMSVSYNQMMINLNQLLMELEEKEKLKKESEYKALIQQIKPHFLYNTLEMIQSMCIDYDDDKVEHAIGLLASFFRNSLSNDDLMIPLEKELLQVSNYLDIQLLRYENQFTYEIENHVDQQAMFLRFTLQPIVENAIYHGIKYMHRCGKIHIKATLTDENIIILVQNEYEKIDKEKIDYLNKLFQSHSTHEAYPGYGMYNVNERLKLHFGEAYCLKISFDDKYVTVTCTHPFIRGNENENINCR